MCGGWVLEGWMWGGWMLGVGELGVGGCMSLGSYMNVGG